MLWRWQCNPEPNSYPKPHITHPSLQSPPAQSTAVIAAKMKTNSTWVSLQETLFHAHTSLEMIQLRPISVLVWGWLFCFVRKTRPFRQNDQLHQKWRLLCQSCDQKVFHSFCPTLFLQKLHPPQRVSFWRNTLYVGKYLVRFISISQLDHIIYHMFISTYLICHMLI